MASLYNISADILRIFSDVEELEGEITDEQYNLLCIKRNELEEKLTSYFHVITEFKKDADFCKAEKKRINDKQKIYENRIEKLKKAVLEAVNNFGEVGKNNKFIELPTVRIFTRNNTSVEFNEPRIEILIEKFRHFIEEVVSADVLYTGEDVDIEGILATINAWCRAEYGDDFSNFTMADLANLEFTITTTHTIENYLKNYPDILKHLGKDIFGTKMLNETSKTHIANILNNTNVPDNEAITTSILVNNQSVQFK